MAAKLQKRNNSQVRLIWKLKLKIEYFFVTFFFRESINIWTTKNLPSSRAYLITLGVSPLPPHFSSNQKSKKWNDQEFFAECLFVATWKFRIILIENFKIYKKFSEFYFSVVLKKDLKTLKMMKATACDDKLNWKMSQSVENDFSRSSTSFGFSLVQKKYKFTSKKVTENLW